MSDLPLPTAAEMKTNIEKNVARECQGIFLGIASQIATEQNALIFQVAIKLSPHGGLMRSHIKRHLTFLGYGVALYQIPHHKDDLESAYYDTASSETIAVLSNYIGSKATDLLEIKSLRDEEWKSIEYNGAIPTSGELWDRVNGRFKILAKKLVSEYLEDRAKNALDTKFSIANVAQYHSRFMYYNNVAMLLEDRGYEMSEENSPDDETIRFTIPKAS